MTITKDRAYLLGRITKYLARHNLSNLHNFSQVDNPGSFTHFAESWRFPIVESYHNPDEPDSYEYNEVTFVYRFNPGEADARDVSVIGTFDRLFEPLPLRRLDDTIYYTITLKIPKGELHYYKFIVDKVVIADPINPQIHNDETGEQWSRFFTDECTHLISFENWERVILDRLTDIILPFQDPGARRFLDYYYNSLDANSQRQTYQLDNGVGAVNYIDKVVAREENHNYIHYEICLELINNCLRQRDPINEPAAMAPQVYQNLLGEMATGSVNGWDYNRYGNPAYFLQLLRRHTLTGAFSHPRYGGNIGAAGWAFLSEKFVDAQGKTLFDWSKAQEQPVGTNQEYLA